MKPLIVQGKYQLDRRLGGGGFGVVYLGHHLESGEEIALKLEYDGTSFSHLENEFYIYEQLGEGSGIPQVYWYGSECEFKVMAFELLGPSLEDLFYYCCKKFSLKTVLLLADQLISRFQFIHSKGYIHRDVKPGNLLMGTGKQGNTVYLTDVGLAKEVEKFSHGHTCPLVIGTLPFASINAHLGKEQSPRDDMESLGYVLLYFLTGSLPWENPMGNSTEKEKITLEKKQQQQQAGINGVPIEFKKYFELIHSDKRLDYGRLRRLFRGLFCRRHFQYDKVFDWTEMMFLETLEAEQETSGTEQESD